MKKHLLLIIVSLVATLLLMGASCDDDSPSSPTESTVKQLNTSTGGNLETNNGSEILVPAGAIPKSTNGNDGVISFSIETNVRELPLEIPSDYSVVGGVTLFGPTNFIFTEPIRLYLPASSLQTLDDVVVLRYSDEKSNWIVVPISEIDGSKKRLGVSVFELGYYAVAKLRTVSYKEPVTLSSKGFGGIRYSHPHSFDYYYTMLIVSFTPKFPENAIVQAVGMSGSTGSQTTGGPRGVTHLIGIPQGNYQLIISRTRRGTLSSLPGPREYYSVPISVTVPSFNYPLGWESDYYSPWGEVSLAGGSWTSTQPTIWPNPTTPYGTGDFQATLTWTNSMSSGTDLDLHLIGPNNIHVYWDRKRSSDASIELDRDWLEDVGNAVENIYSLKVMPSGQYKVYVNVYGGDVPKQFEVRIIRRGSTVKTFRGTGTQVNNAENLNNMILIDSFTL